MTQINVIVRQKDNVTPINGASIKATWKDWLGSNQSVEVISDAQGRATIETNASNANVEITATKGASNDKASVFVNLLGTPEPDTVVFNLNFNLGGIVGDTVGNVGSVISKDLTYIAIAGVVIAVVLGVVYVNSAGSKGVKVSVPEKKEPKEEKTQ